MPKKEEFEYNSIQDSESISRYLNALIEGFRRKQLSFNSEQQEIVLTPKDLIEMTLKAKKKGEKTKLTLKFTWKETDFQSPGADKLKIFPES